MPIDVQPSTGATKKILTNDQQGLPTSGVYGGAYTFGDDLLPAPPVPNPWGLSWQLGPVDLTSLDDIGVNFLYDLSSFVSTYGNGPSGVTFHIKMRSIIDSLRATPQFFFQVASGCLGGTTKKITLDGAPFSSFNDTWSVYERALTQSELKSLVLDSTGNCMSLVVVGDFVSFRPPQVLEVAWFAVSFKRP